MGRGKRNHRIRRQGSFEIDLLTTAFGLPSRIMIQRAEEKAPKVMVQYSPKDDHDDDYDTDSSFSSFNEDDEFSEVSELQAPKTPSPAPKSRSTFFRLRRPKQQRSRIPSPPPPRRLSRPRPSKQSQIRSSPRFSPRSSPNSSARSTRSSGASSRRSAPVRAARAPVASFVQSSASFPQLLPVQVLPGTNSVSTSSPNFFGSAPQSGTLPIQSQYYYQPQLAFIQPTQAAVQMPQTMAPPGALPISMYTVPAQQSLPLAPPQPKHNHEPPGWAASSGPYAQDLQRIQKDIDLKMSYLAHQPEVPILRGELRRQQDLLNATLNAAIAKQEISEEEKTEDVLEKSELQRPTPATPKEEVPLNLSTSVVQNDEQKGPTPSSPLVSPSPKIVPAESVVEEQDQVHNHLCSGCGCVRSAKFHAKHPFNLQQKPIVNFCRICRDKKIRRGVVGRYHFCFDCGQARSKNFQREHAILPGDTILKNYCGPCLKEMRHDEGIVDASQLSMVCYHLEKPEQGANRTQGNKNSMRRPTNPSITTDDDDDDSLEAHFHLQGSKQGTLTPTKMFTSSPIDFEDEISAEPTPARRRPLHIRKPRMHHLDSLNLERTKSMLSPAAGPPSSPFLPTRTFGSAERRAERKSCSPTGDHQESPTKLEVPQNYRAPYFEDSDSAPYSRKVSPLSSILSHGLDGADALGTRDRKERLQTPKHPKQKKRGDRQATSSEVRDGSDESEISFDSTRNSSRSSGSKTVRFKSSVDIRGSAALNDESSDSNENRAPMFEKKHFRSGNSPLGSEQKPFSSSKPKEHEQGSEKMDHFTSSHDFSETGQHQLGRYSDGQRTPSPGFSNGAFSKNFGVHGYEWEQAETPMQSRRQSPAFGSSFGAYFHKSKGRDTGFAGPVDERYGADDEEPSTPRLPFQRPSSVFSSLYNQPGGSRSKVNISSSMANPELFSPRGHDSKEPARDH